MWRDITGTDSQRPVRKWLSSNHERRDRWNPGSRIVASVLTTLLTTGTDDVVLEVVTRHLVLSGIVFPRMSVLAKLSQHSANT